MKRVGLRDGALTGVALAALIAAAQATAQTQPTEGPTDSPQPGSVIGSGPGEVSPSPADLDAQDDIVVRGIRGSLLRSIDTKRDASTIVDAISAEELGKFPNRNVAEALANIPGVTVGRDGRGEGRNITVRGLGQSFAITTLNGRILPTDSADRSFAFDVLPSEMIAGAEVQKAVQVSELEGSIGGNVDLRTARPFDRKGFHASFGVEAQYNDLADEPGYKASGVVSGTFADDRIGVLISGSYNKYKFRTDNLGEFSLTDGTETDYGVDFNGNGGLDAGGPAYIWPDYYSVGYVLGERERIGGAAALQAKASDTLELRIDGLFSKFNVSQSNYRQSNYLNPLADDGSVAWAPGSIRADGNVISQFDKIGYPAEVLTTDEPRASKTYLIGGHADWKPSDKLAVTLDGYFGQAEDNTGGQNRFVVAGIPDASASYSVNRNSLPTLIVTLPDGRPISEATNDDFRPHYIGIQGQNIRDRVYGGTLDVAYDVDAGPLRAIAVGGAYTDRQKIFAQFDNQYTTSCNYCGYPFTFGAIDAEVTRPAPRTGILYKLPGGFPRNFPAFDIDAYLAALPRADNNPAILNPNSCTDGDGAAIPGCTLSPYPAGYSTQIIQQNLPASYTIKERTWGGYVQAKLEGERWRADVGVRLVGTKVTSAGYSASIARIIPRAGTQDYDVDFNDVEEVNGSGDYFRVLPAANFAYDLADGLRLRLAASKAISRPTFGQLSPAKDATSAQSGTFNIFDAGNPDLKPTEADQLDASLEYYPTRRLAITLAAFYKHITNFVTTLPVDVTITPTDQPANQQPSFDFVEYTVLNGDTAKVYGVEVGAQWFLDNGLGFQANATYNRSRATSGDITTDLAQAIPFSANAKVFYEGDGLGVQVSYNYASRFVQAQTGSLSYLPIKEEPYNEVSASISYDFLPRLTAYVQGSNLAGSAVRRFNDNKLLPAFYEYSGRSFFAGLRTRF